MNFFSKLSKNETHSYGTTSNFYIGSPEAEGESTYASKIKLSEIFSDFLNVFEELNSEKFVITGRKGSGKSAVAEYVLHKASSEPNVFCNFIKTRDFQIHKLIQLGKEKGFDIEEKLLFEWILLTHLILLLTNDHSLQDKKEFKDLQTFIQKNSGFIDIKDYQIEEIVNNRSFEVNIEYFKRAFQSIFKRDPGIKESRTPFYKLLPLLRATVLKLLENTATNGNEFFLIFDDLDIGFKESDLNSVENIAYILRIAKDYNIDFFGKNNLHVKVIVLLRDDIKKILVKYNADTAKIFSSYEIPLVWYEHENFKFNENAVALKQLINKRIAVNFDVNSFDYNSNDPWSSLVRSDQYYNGSSFKYVIDHTFFRPRDLILFFKPLSSFAFKVPITTADINKLVLKYVEELVNEVQNELAASFSPEDISKIFLTFKSLIRKNAWSKEEIIDEFIRQKLEYDPELALVLLFDYSLIGNIDFTENPPKIHFKHREKREEPYFINFDQKFIFHTAIKIYLEKRNN